MAFTPEDGSGLANANSFASVSQADDYFLDRGVAAWAALQAAAKQAALVSATDYMEGTYRASWIGQPASSVQALSWPRIGPPDNVPAGVPRQVVNATAELALRASRGPLAPDQGPVKKRTKVGPLEVEYDTDAPAYTTYRSVDASLSGLLVGGASGGSFRQVVRT